MIEHVIEVKNTRKVIPGQVCMIPEMEELHDTVQIIRDSAYARQLACTPEPLTIAEQLKRAKQILQDSIVARKLSKYGA